MKAKAGNSEMGNRQEGAGAFPIPPLSRKFYIAPLSIGKDQDMKKEKR